MLAPSDEVLRKAVKAGFGADAARSFDRATAKVIVIPSTGGGAFNTTVQRVLGGTGATAWSLIVKELSAHPTNPAWDREADVYNDAAWLEAVLPAGLRSPRLLASERDATRVALLLEDLTSSPDLNNSARISDGDLISAARLLAEFNASSATQRPWWSIDFLDTEFATLADHPDRLEHRRDDPRLDELRQQLLRLHADASNQLAIVRTLPHGPAHLDAYSRNLVIDRTTGDIGLIDWANAGSAPLGADQATLFTLTLDYLDLDSASIAEFEQSIIDAMLSGFAHTNSNVTTDESVIAFKAIARLRHLAMMMNALPMAERRDSAVSEIVGRPLDEIIDRWLAVGRHFLR